MRSTEEITTRIFDPSADFMRSALEVFDLQRSSVNVYRAFVELLGRSSNKITTPEELPFLPVEFFRSSRVIIEDRDPQLYFESSGTTGNTNSRHYLVDTDMYKSSLVKSFEAFYGPVDQYTFFAMLPSYLEREHASLVYMARHLMEASGSEGGGFYKFNYDELIGHLAAYRGERKIILIGVTFALWDLAEHPSCPDLSDVIVIETGGMKGRRKEIVREQLHDILNRSFHTKNIHSEYGMTELLSQAYSKGEGIFRCPPWMKVLVRDPYDPLHVSKTGRGALNIIDLANIYSCAFIATNDIGEVFEDGSFTVSGRLDHSRLRGCNLMFA